MSSYLGNMDELCPDKSHKPPSILTVYLVIYLGGRGLVTFFASAESDHRAACLSLLGGHTRLAAVAGFPIAGENNSTVGFVD